MKTTEEILQQVDTYIEEIHAKYSKADDERDLTILDAQLQAYCKIKIYIEEGNK